MKSYDLMLLKNQEKIKDKGFHRFKYFMVFFIGSLIGVLYEDVLMWIRTGQFETHRGVIFGPLNPLYGAGFVLFVWILWKIPKWYHQLTYGTILLGALEYYASFFEELITGGVSWDYSSIITNIDGRTTVLFALGWGLGAVILMQFVYPYFLKLLLKIDCKWLRITVDVLFGIYCFDMIYSYTALLLCYLRQGGYTSKTFIGRFFEKYYTKESLKKYFVNWS